MYGFDAYKQYEKMADMRIQEEGYRKSKEAHSGVPSHVNRWIGNTQTLLYIQLPLLLFLLTAIAAYIFLFSSN